MLGHESRWKDNELRYSLRSVETHLRGYRNIIVVGECPKWLQNVVHIPAKDPFEFNKEANIAHKLLLACQLSFISYRVLFMNDDHFILEDNFVEKIPAHYEGDLQVEEHTAYDKCRNNTYRRLKELHYSTKNFDVHMPTPIAAGHFVNAMSMFDWQKDIMTAGYLVKSLYANVWGIQGQLCTDLKIRGSMTKEQIEKAVEDRWAFSIGEGAVDLDMRRFLQARWPKASSYERE